MILGVIIATSMFPGISVVVPLLRFFTDLGWMNTYQAMIIPNLSFAIPLAVWNLTTFMKQLPFDLEEAAMIDGCTKWQAFRKVLLPLAAPGVFTTAILTFIHTWNEFIIALSMISYPAVQTATVKLGWDPAAWASVGTELEAARQAHGAAPSWALENHDIVRSVTRFSGGALGTRRARAALLALLGLPGAAYIYQGQELGLPEVDVPVDARVDPMWARGGITRDGARVPLPWTASPSLNH